MPLYVKTIEKEFTHPVDDSVCVNPSYHTYVRLDASRLNNDGMTSANPFVLIKPLAQEFYMESHAEQIKNSGVSISFCGLLDRFPCLIWILGNKCFVIPLGVQKSSYSNVFPPELNAAAGLLFSVDEIDPDQFVAWDRCFVTIPYYQNGIARVLGHELVNKTFIEAEFQMNVWSQYSRSNLTLDLPKLANTGDPEQDLYYEGVYPNLQVKIPVIPGVAPFYWRIQGMIGNANYGARLTYVMPGKTKSLSEKETSRAYLDPYKGVIGIDAYEGNVQNL